MFVFALVFVCFEQQLKILINLKLNDKQKNEENMKAHTVMIKLFVIKISIDLSLKLFDKT